MSCALASASCSVCSFFAKKSAEPDVSLVAALSILLRPLVLASILAHSDADEHGRECAKCFATACSTDNGSVGAMGRRSFARSSRSGPRMGTTRAIWPISSSVKRSSFTDWGSLAASVVV